jgi:hypothetical protein
MNPGNPGSLLHPFARRAAKVKLRNTLALCRKKNTNFTASDKVADRRTESSRLYKRSSVVYF